MTMGKYILDIPQRNIKPDTSGVHLYLKDINPSFSLNKSRSFSNWHTHVSYVITYLFIF